MVGELVLDETRYQDGLKVSKQIQAAQLVEVDERPCVAHHLGSGLVPSMQSPLYVLPDVRLHQVWATGFQETSQRIDDHVVDICKPAILDQGLGLRK